MSTPSPAPGLPTGLTSTSHSLLVAIKYCSDRSNISNSTRNSATTRSSEQQDGDLKLAAQAELDTKH